MQKTRAYGISSVGCELVQYSPEFLKAKKLFPNSFAAQCLTGNAARGAYGTRRLLYLPGVRAGVPGLAGAIIEAANEVNSHHTAFHRLRILALALAAYGAAGLAGIARDVALEAVFPLRAGTTWEYEGSLTRLEPDKNGENHPRRVEIRVKTAVIETASMAQYYGALVRNAPMAGGETAANQSVGLYVLSGKKQVYYLEGNEARMAFETIRKDGDVHSYLHSLDPILDFPLTPGKAFGADDNELRKDKCYCWVVARRSAWRKGVDGWPIPGRAGEGYTLTYTMGTGDMRLDFVPGVGITAYRYRHHGSIDRWNLRLVRMTVGDGE